MPKVKVKNLTKIFGEKSQVNKALPLTQEGVSKNEILDQTGATVGVYEASFDVKEGEFFVIMGLSGSGKSTLIRLLNRLIEPTGGSIYIDDQNISTMDKEALREVRRQKINMVFQNFALFPHRSILENTEFGLEIRGISEEERKKKAETALDNAGLLPFKDQYPDQLSGGMQQRVGLARALSNDPDVLLMDEAFSALDPLIRREMQDELIQLQEREQRTIIFITHDLNEALRLGDRIAIMRDGQIVQIGTGEEILTNPENDYVREFVEDVDRSLVLTAENIMTPAVAVNVDRLGPNMALKALRDNQIRTCLATNHQDELLGYLEIQDVIEARNQNKDLSDIVKTGVPTVNHDQLINELFDINNPSSAPVTVVDDNRILGVIRRSTLIDALSKSAPTNQDKNEVAN